MNQKRELEKKSPWSFILLEKSYTMVGLPKKWIISEIMIKKFFITFPFNWECVNLGRTI